MRAVIETARYRKDFKRLIKRGKRISKLVRAVRTLAERGTLPLIYMPHPLQGEWADANECHLEYDWLLIYAVTDSTITLYRTGTHADLFE